MRSCLCLLSILWLSVHVCLAQRVTNVKAEPKGNVVIITYDLIGTIRGQVYNVAVYSSHNNKAEPLTYVRGDVGKNLVPGRGKTIEWGAKKELKDFEGEVRFEVRATLVASPIRFMAPQTDARYKRGNVYQINWLGALANEEMLLELYSDSVKLMNVTRLPNKNGYQWEIPKDLKPNENYRLRISSVQKPNNFALSGRFTIRRKIPLAVKVVPAGLLSVAAGYFIYKSTIKNAPIEEDLPLPPGPE